MPLTVQTLAEAFIADERFLSLDFADLHAVYHREKMDMNFVAAWCMMQYMDAEKTKAPIAQEQELEEIAGYKKGLHKTKLLTVAQYIRRAFLKFQNKSHNGLYNFNVTSNLKVVSDITQANLSGYRTNQKSIALTTKASKTCSGTFATSSTGECCHKVGLFFDPEGSLVISDEYKSLREWNNTMPYCIR
uniref:Uncharacterized protein n=1 Tax=Oryza nivara TaxID=4536 RepID=A0A0E0J125_ORYNI